MLDARLVSPPFRTVPRTAFITRSDALVGLLLCVVVFVGGVFRFTSLNWDDYIRFHPDERFLTMNVAPILNEGLLNFTLSQSDPPAYSEDERQAVLAQKRAYCAERYPATGGVGGYFDARCSDWNPHNLGSGDYVYGTLPLFLTRVTAEALNALGPEGTIWRGYWTDPNAIQLVWRGLSAITDTLVILVVFLIGLRLHNKWVGLVAAALYAACVFPIQLAHFGTVDAMSNFFVALCVYFAVRVQTGGKQLDYAAFGLVFGMALATRINILPVVGLLIVAAAMQVVPLFFSKAPYSERDRALTNGMGGLVVAGVVTLVTFRLLNPYAFLGPGVFGIRPNPAFLDDIATAQRLVSGEAESPPNYQWIGRVDYLYPLQNMVLWGMGLALGLTSWLGWAWSGWRILRGRAAALQNLLLFGWVLVYFGWLGANWVSTMRYFLPLYPTLTVLAAWLLVEWARPAEQPAARRPAGKVALVAVIAATTLWALMFTNIYRQMATFTQASLWTWENVPGDFAMRIDGAGVDVPLLNVAIGNTPIYSPDSVPIADYLFQTATRYVDDLPTSGVFRPDATGVVYSIHAPYLGDPLDDSDAETVKITITQSDTSEVVGTATLQANLTRTAHPLGASYDIPLDAPMTVLINTDYVFTVTVSGGPVIGAGSVMALESQWEEVMPAKVCTMPDGITLADNPPSGMFTAYQCNGRSVWDGLLNGYLINTHDEDAPAKLDRMLTILEQTDYLMVPTNRRYDTHSRNPARWPLTNAFYAALFDGELGFTLERTFEETFELGPLRVSDQYLPTYSAPAWLNEFEAEEAFHVYDHPTVFVFRKNEDYNHTRVEEMLTSVSLNRADFGLYGYNDPTITNIRAISSLEADEMPTQLMMPPDMREIQYANGTWSARFNRDSFINAYPILTVAVWWVAILLFGWTAWPLLFMAFPALADKGFGFSKIIGLLLVSWGLWVIGSMRIPVWSQVGVVVGLIVLTVVSTVIVFRHSDRFAAYVRGHWRLLLGIELLTFAAFMLMLAIRLTNPDLWTTGFGGEKPMDFAYFNAVLRSSVFPPLDPWYAGGYLNYYYFGFVIVGSPTLLLGVVPSTAYNLILPTLFALTGIAAFSCAFNIVSAWRGQDEPAADGPSSPSEKEAAADEVAPADGVAVTSRPRRAALANPWVAGILALLMAVVLGNLDTVRVVANGIAQMGGYQVPQGFVWYLDREAKADYQEQNGGLVPNQVVLDAIAQQVAADSAANRLSDRLAYEAFKITSLVSSFTRGMGLLLEGQQLRISPERWFWAPTRIIAEIPTVNDSSIHEMPIFTYIYGDLHAHMIAMPLILFAVAFVFHELMAAGADPRRSALAQAAALGIGALVVGMSKAVNSWDWPTLTILSVAGLGYAWWLRQRTITRGSLLDMVVRIGGFLILADLVVAPYDAFFATAFTQLKLWDGGNTPVWAYLDIHGLFLFMLVSLLFWDTVRWMRATRVRSLRGRAALLSVLLFGCLLVWLAAVVFFFRGERVAIIVLPLVVWIALLFFRPGQSRAVQYVLVLGGLSLCITLGVEFVVLANDNGRQNMVFKFYNQVWLFFSVVGASAFAWIVAGTARWRTRLAVPWYGVAALLITTAALYPLMATQGKAVFRLGSGTPLTLDGLEYMQYANYTEVVDRLVMDQVEQPVYEQISLLDDYRLIRWLQDNIVGSPVIIEAQSYLLLYQWGGRISINTGLPSVVGWDYHQTQQRSLGNMPQMVRMRVANVNAFYTTPIISEAANLLYHYEVGYVIVGALERARYSASGGLEKLDRMVEMGLLSVVYREGISVVYQVNREALPAAALASTDVQIGIEIPGG